MSKRQRRHHSSHDKVKILRLHLLEQRPVSDLCDEYAIHPTLFYKWQKEFFEHGSSVFERQQPRATDNSQKQIAALQAKLLRKAEVLSEVTEEMVRLKKELGEI